jgi:16S rRNA (uracil1498-N3)-methyltransferase
MNNHAPWFYAAALDESAAAVLLTEEEARHVMAARRLVVGDTVCVTNGRGLVACGVITSASNRPPEVAVSIAEIQKLPPGIPVHLASALPKGDRQKTMLDMATQAGMQIFTPLRCERSIAAPGKNAAERWQRVTIESSKQCRRAWLPEIRPEAALADFLDAQSSGAQLFLASADGVSVSDLPQAAMNQELVILVGPEGGFTSDELILIHGHCRGEVRLAPSVLRTETAAVLGVALLGQLSNRQ